MKTFAYSLSQKTKKKKYPSTDKQLYSDYVPHIQPNYNNSLGIQIAEKIKKTTDEIIPKYINKNNDIIINSNMQPPSYDFISDKETNNIPITPSNSCISFSTATPIKINYDILTTDVLTNDQSKSLEININTDIHPHSYDFVPDKETNYTPIDTSAGSILFAKVKPIKINYDDLSTDSLPNDINEPLEIGINTNINKKFTMIDENIESQNDNPQPENGLNLFNSKVFRNNLLRVLQQYDDNSSFIVTKEDSTMKINNHTINKTFFVGFDPEQPIDTTDSSIKNIFISNKSQNLNLNLTENTAISVNPDSKSIAYDGNNELILFNSKVFRSELMEVLKKYDDNSSLITENDNEVDLFNSKVFRNDLLTVLQKYDNNELLIDTNDESIMKLNNLIIDKTFFSEGDVQIINNVNSEPIINHEQIIQISDNLQNNKLNLIPTNEDLTNNSRDEMSFDMSAPTSLNSFIPTDLKTTDLGEREQLVPLFDGVGNNKIQILPINEELTNIARDEVSFEMTTTIITNSVILNNSKQNKPTDLNSNALEIDIAGNCKTDTFFKTSVSIDPTNSNHILSFLRFKFPFVKKSLLFPCFFVIRRCTNVVVSNRMCFGITSLLIGNTL